MPSDHATVLDHEMELPNNGGEPRDPGRTWRGQRFVRFSKRDQETIGWVPHGVTGFEARDTGIAEGTQVRIFVQFESDFRFDFDFNSFH